MCPALSLSTAFLRNSLSLKLELGWPEAGLGDPSPFPTVPRLQAHAQGHVAFSWMLRTQTEVFMLVKQMLLLTEPSLQPRGRGFSL